jgi:hypothetical protein
VSFQAGLIAQGRGQMGFTDSDPSQEDDIGLIGDKLQAEEVFDL